VEITDFHMSLLFVIMPFNKENHILNNNLYQPTAELLLKELPSKSWY